MSWTDHGPFTLWPANSDPRGLLGLGTTASLFRLRLLIILLVFSFFFYSSVLSLSCFSSSSSCIWLGLALAAASAGLQPYTQAPSERMLLRATSGQRAFEERQRSSGPNINHGTHGWYLSVLTSFAPADLAHASLARILETGSGAMARCDFKIFSDDQDPHVHAADVDRA